MKNERVYMSKQVVTECPCCHRPIAADNQMVVDFDARIVMRNGKALTLVGKQWETFAFFARKFPAPVSNSMLMDAVYGGDPDGGPDSLNIVSVVKFHLRKKLKPLGIGISSTGGPGSTSRLVLFDVV